MRVACIGFDSIIWPKQTVNDSTWNNMQYNNYCLQIELRFQLYIVFYSTIDRVFPCQLDMQAEVRIVKNILSYLAEIADSYNELQRSFQAAWR